jgi:flagellar biosynthesis protein FliP
MKHLATFLLIGLVPVSAFAGPVPILPTQGFPPIAGLGGGQAPWTIIILLTLLTLVPALLLSMTPFVRLLIVFHFLRQALGTQSTPTNQTLIGLALVLTFFLMPSGLPSSKERLCLWRLAKSLPWRPSKLLRSP